MSCDHVELPGGGRAIVCSRSKRPGRCFACFLSAGFLCDWKLPNGGLCNRPICVEHRTNVGPEKDLCPEHAEAYEVWKKKREEKTP